MISLLSAVVMLSTAPVMPVSPPPVPVMPVSPPPVPSSTTPPFIKPSPPPVESWEDKMWRRYRENRR